MKIAVIGAGAMGGSFGAHLSRTGQDVQLIDTWEDHVNAITVNGIQAVGALGDHVVKLPASTTVTTPGWADCVIAFIDTNATRDAVASIQSALADDGMVITMQNGIGNIEALCEGLGAEKVIGGSSMCSAAAIGPGHVALTHLDTTTIGEVDGADSERVRTLAGVLENAGFPIAISPDIMTVIWKKFLVNIGINALCAVSGLRTGEMTRIPEMFELQNHVLDEALAVTKAKNIALDDSIRETIIKAAHYRFNKPSMLQHITAGRKTEIDAINAALVREAKTLGIATPYNEALVALLKGRETSRIREVHEADLDFDEWEARIQNEPIPTRQH